MLKDKLKLTHLDSDWLELEELRDGSLKRHTMMEREREKVPARLFWGWSRCRNKKFNNAG